MDPRKTPTTGRQHAVGRSSGISAEADASSASPTDGADADRFGGSLTGSVTETLHTETDGAGQVSSVVRRTILPSGLRIVTEQMAGSRSAAVGVWVGVGSRDEDAVLHGCSHFLEHLLFKGTRERSALDISVALDEIGGEFNAFTAKELTCFYARVLGHDLPLAIDVLGDMITSSQLTAEDVDAERDVILDEIAMHDDDPDDVVHNLFAEAAWGPDSPLGRTIAGTTDSIEALTRDQIADFYAAHYRPSTMVIAVAGQVEHDRAVEQVVAAFSRQAFLEREEAPEPPRTHQAPVPVHAARRETTRPFEQVNLVVGGEGLVRDDERRFALGVLSTALGGGTSSRLFQEIRERRGLAYSVYSFTSSYADSGLVGVAVGCLPDKADEVLATIRTELASVAEHGLSVEELARGKGQLRGGLVLGLEDSSARMSRLGKGELVHDRLLSVDEVLDRIDAVTIAEVSEVAADLLRRPELLAVVGPA
ncbi:M16 family metallopeptidase [Nocardioides insulae]|uniref:M16 family metallopeptidase n=1 Tax=Nocardioides insulae TaxID=394734 RepID=UPI0004089B51|nr:pitrilysin family protein [Nocardioides insulae]